MAVINDNVSTQGSIGNIVSTFAGRKGIERTQCSVGNVVSTSAGKNGIESTQC